MFYGASSFNEDIGNWAVQTVTSMVHMFNGATKFDQDLGWCVDDDVDLRLAFYTTPCASTYCGVWCPETKKRGTESGRDHRWRGRGRRATACRRRLLLLPSAQGLHDG